MKYISMICNSSLTIIAQTIIHIFDILLCEKQLYTYVKCFNFDAKDDNFY